MSIKRLILLSLAASAIGSASAQDITQLSMSGSAINEEVNAVNMLSLNDTRGSQKVCDLYFADPTVYAEGGKFYASGTRAYGPAGFTLLESTDLMNWHYAMPDSMSVLKGRDCWGTSSFWAPQYFKDDAGKYHIAYVANEQCCIAHCDVLNGHYYQDVQEPVDASVKNIDPFVFRDDDGKYYFYHVRFPGGNILHVAELDPTTWKIKEGTLKECFRNSQSWEWTNAYPAGLVMEGPTVIKIDNLYYLFYSANHYMSTDYAVGYATAPTPMGPWTKNPDNPIIHRNIVGEMGSGHGDVFFDNEGNMRYVYHVHRSNTTVHPRCTRIVTLKVDKSKGEPYNITADPETIIYPTMDFGQRTGKYTCFATLKAGTFTFTGKDVQGNDVIYGTDADGKLVAGGDPFTCDKEGIYQIVADIVRGTVEFTEITALSVRGNIANGDIQIPYAGNGIFSGDVTFDKTNNNAFTSKSIFFRLNNSSSLSLKRIPGTNNLTIPGDGIEGEYIHINNGTYHITVDLNKATFAITADTDPERITVLGTTLATGSGATTGNGYISLLDKQLSQRKEEGKTDHKFYTSNISTANTTSMDMVKDYNTVTADHAKYVIVAANLVEDGIGGNSSPNITAAVLTSNLQKIINNIRAEGRVPVVVNNTPYGDMVSEEYKQVKNVNNAIQGWDVLSVNALGAVDNASGQWCPSLYNNKLTPNDEGHRQIANAFVPSTFDAIAAGKTIPASKSEGTELELKDGATLTFTPEAQLNTFTITVRVKLELGNAGKIFSFINGDNGAESYVALKADGKLIFTTPGGSTVTTAKAFADGEYHYVTLMSYYGRSRTALFIDNRAGMIARNTQLDPRSFTIGDIVKNQEATDGDDAAASTMPLSITELSFWRSSLSDTEITSLAEGKLLRSSLELYAPMNVAAESEGVTDGCNVYDVPNLAPSLNTLKLNVPVNSGIGAVTADNLNGAEPVAYYTTDGKLAGTTSAPAAGLYIVRYSDGTARTLILR